jgi:hypothetical protein
MGDALFQGIHVIWRNPCGAVLNIKILINFESEGGDCIQREGKLLFNF